MTVTLYATAARGTEEVVAGELAALGLEVAGRDPGGVRFRGAWDDCWRANWRLRAANRVLVELAAWPAGDGDALAAGARALVRGELPLPAGLDAGELFAPGRTLAVAATATASAIRDTRWAALRLKDGLVDGQGCRSACGRARG